MSYLPRKLQREVDNAWATTLRRDTAEAGRVKRLTVVDEIRIVENVDERRLEFALDCFSNRDALHEARVHVEETRTIE